MPFTDGVNLTPISTALSGPPSGVAGELVGVKKRAAGFGAGVGVGVGVGLGVGVGVGVGVGDGVGAGPALDLRGCGYG